MGKLPAFMFYPGDWLQDEIAACSLGAQGLLLRMMFIGHGSSRYGYLVCSDGSPIPPGTLAQRCGCTLEQYETLITELDSVGKLGRTPQGVIFIPRMVRDAQKRALTNKRVRKFRARQSELTTCDDVTRVKRACNASENEIDSSTSKPKNKSSSEDFNSTQYARRFCEEHAICGTQPFDAVKCALEFIVRDEDVGLPGAFTALSDRLLHFRADPNQYKGSEKNWFAYGKYRRPKPIPTTRYNAFAELDREREEALRRREAEKRASAN